MTTNERSTIRQTTPGMRRMLLVASGLVFLVGIQLFILTEHTDRFFAWTIDSSLTAAFLGGSYWAACAMEFSAFRQRIWPRARVAVPAVLLFTTLTLLVTLWHWDRFHFDHPDSETRFAAWAWLIVYAVVPPVMGILLYFQLRQPGGDPARELPLPTWVRAVLLIHAVIMVPFGLALLLAPETASGVWPWSLTPLTGRAVGAWLFALGVAAAHAQWENEWGRLRVAAASYAVFGILQFAAIIRYPGELGWGSGSAWVYLAFIGSIVGLGLYGWWKSGRLESSYRLEPHPSH